MKKKYLGRNINIFLILIIIVSISSIIGMSTYYGQRYKAISRTHNDMARDLQNTTVLLDSTLSELNQLKNTLSQTSTDIQRYDELYLNKVNELEKTQEELAKKESELTLRNAEIIRISNTLLDEQNKIMGLQARETQLENDLRRANTKINNCQRCVRDSDEEDCIRCLE